MLSASNTLVYIHRSKCRWTVFHSDERTQWFNGARQLRWQHISPIQHSFNIFYIYQAFSLLFHKALHPPSLLISLSVHLSLSFCGTPSRFPN